MSKVCILGGTGFVGGHIAARLAQDGVDTLIPTRSRQRHREAALLPRTEVAETPDLSPETLKGLFAGCDAVINLVGILNEVGNSTFEGAHFELPKRVLAACKAAGVPRLLQMSALNAAVNGPSRYLQTKGRAQKYLHENAAPEVAVTFFRPSVIFGPDDSFFNRFAGLLGSLPGPFPLACPDACFAPVYVGDVAEAFARGLRDAATCDQGYDLCGPRVLRLRELVQYTAAQMGLKKTVIGLPDFASRMQALALGLVPGKPFSMDNYLSMKIDSLCDKNGLQELGIEPTDIDAVVPYYLGARDQRGRYPGLRRTA